MGQTTNHKGGAKSPQGQSAGAESQAAETVAVDQDRLIWDPEYRREIARLLRQSPPQRS